MFDVTSQRNDNSMFASALHFVVISAIVSCKSGRAQCMGVNEAFDTFTLSKWLSSSMAISLAMLTMSTWSTKS
jgi:hypothetical protein